MQEASESVGRRVFGEWRRRGAGQAPGEQGGDLIRFFFRGGGVTEMNRGVLHEARRCAGRPTSRAVAAAGAGILPRLHACHGRSPDRLGRARAGLLPAGSGFGCGGGVRSLGHGIGFVALGEEKAVRDYRPLSPEALQYPPTSWRRRGVVAGAPRGKLASALIGLLGLVKAMFDLVCGNYSKR